MASAAGFLERWDRRLRSVFSLRRGFLRIRSLYSRVPYGKLKLYHLIGLSLEDVLIVERNTGRILDEWHGGLKRPEGTARTQPRDSIASLLAAIGALEANPKALFHSGVRPIDLDGGRAHLHMTPAYILATRYGGPAVRKLERHAGAALQKSLKSAPSLLFFTGGDAGVLQGSAQQVAAAIEQLLLQANLPPHGRKPRPVFAYTAAAILSLCGIAGTGEAIVHTYDAGSFFAEEFGFGRNVPSRPIPLRAAPVDEAAVIRGQAEAANRGPASVDSGALPYYSDKKHATASSTASSQSNEKQATASSAAGAQSSEKQATASSAAGAQSQAAQQDQSPSWKPNPSLPQLSTAESGRQPDAVASVVDNATKAALAQLRNFDEKVPINAGSMRPAYFAPQNGGGEFTSAMPALPGAWRTNAISLSSQEVRVGLFSTGNSGSTLFSASESGISLGTPMEGPASATGTGVSGAPGASAAAPAPPGSPAAPDPSAPPAPPAPPGFGGPPEGPRPPR